MVFNFLMIERKELTPFDPNTMLISYQVVDDASSCLNDSSLEIIRHISSDHMDMCRFSGLDDVEYRKVIAALDHIQKQIVKGSANPSSLGRYTILAISDLLLRFADISSVLSESQQQSLAESLWHHTIDARYATIKPAHAKTCEWLLEKAEYQDWLNINKTRDHHGILWIKGKPGSGKSTLVKFAVANARKARTETVVISFFFNARGEDLEKTTLGMYRSLLYQILKAFPDLRNVLRSLRSTVPREGEIYKWEKDELQDVFATAIEHLGQRHLSCFIDALDECEEDQIRDLVAFLERLGQRSISSRINFHVCLSSRHYPYISIKNGIQISLEDQEDHVNDMTKYLNSTLKAGRGIQVDVIKEEILHRASGIFLWVVLVVQILNKEYDHGRIHALRKRLKEIPDGLDKLFEEILTRDRENMEELILCLQWILYATRPLKQEELYYAVVSGTDPDALAVTDYETTTQDMERFILSSSKGLVETTKLKAKTVQFIHESVREFLLGKHGFNKLKHELASGLSQDRLKQCCYNYMEVYISEYLPSKTALPVASSEEAKKLRESISKKAPLLEYAVHNVLYHADAAGTEGITQKAFVEKFERSAWIRLDNVFERYQIRRYTSKASLLYIFAEKGFSNLIRTQLDLEADPDNAIERREEERYVIPLCAALANTNVNKETIQALLTPKVQVRDGKCEFHNAQCECSYDCRTAAADTLIKERPNHDLLRHETLLGWAVSCGHESVVYVLLSKSNIDLNRENSVGRTPLLLAAKNGLEKMTSLLLSKGANPDSRDDCGRTPLLYAAQIGHKEIVDLLLSKGANPDSRDICDRTPLSYAATKGREEIVDLLLSRHVDTNSTDWHGWTPLSFAVSNRHEGVIRLLHAFTSTDTKDEKKSD